MGGRAGMEQRKGGDAGHLLLRAQPVENRGPETAPPHRHHPLGGRERHLPRFGLPRGHPEPVPGAVVQGPGDERPVRARREREKTPRDRRIRRRPHYAHRGGTRGRIASTPSRNSRNIPSTAPGTGSAPATSRRLRCRSSPAPTGVDRASTRVGTSTATSNRPRSRNGSKRTGIRTGRSFRAPTGWTSRSAFSTIS